jgi:hypothetical protein
MYMHMEDASVDGVGGGSTGDVDIQLLEEGGGQLDDELNDGKDDELNDGMADEAGVHPQADAASTVEEMNASETHFYANSLQDRVDLDEIAAGKYVRCGARLFTLDSAVLGLAPLGCM